MESGPLVNSYNTHYSNPDFASDVVPTGPHTVAPLTGGKRRRKRRRTSTKRRPKKRRPKRRPRQTRRRRRRRMRGGANGHTQFDNNRGGISNTFSLANTKLSAGESALANPPPYQWLKHGGVDNLDHYAKNGYGHTGSGSGFPSRGWF